MRVYVRAIRVRAGAGAQEKPKNRARARTIRPHPLEKKGVSGLGAFTQNRYTTPTL